MLHFLASPHHLTRLGDFLQLELGKKEWTNFRAAIAFAKISGTQYVHKALRTFAGTTSVSVGIDHAGTSVEALQDLLTAVEKNGALWIYKNQANTFHPKIYLFHNDERAKIAIGSGNLTKGGLYKNAEASVVIDLDLSIVVDKAFFVDVIDTLDLWQTAKTGICELADAKLLALLQASGELLTEAECNAVTKAAKGASAPSKAGPKPPLVFGSTPVPAAPTAVPIPVAAAPSAGSSAASTKPSSGLPVFGMTLKNTDVGIGQTTPGTAVRSPEVFIPLKALDLNPNFWFWKDSFTPDSSRYKADLGWRALNGAWIAGESAKPNRKPRPLDKLDWADVQVTLNGKPLSVHFGFNPKKKDIRIRHADIRAAGQVDDILIIRATLPGSPYAYEIEVIGTADKSYSTYFAKLKDQVPNSPKRIGFF